MITNALITGTKSSPTRAYTASDTGEAIPTGNRQDSAITSIVVCNVTAAPAIISMYLVKDGNTPDTVNYSNLFVNELEVPAGETVFFSDERIVLDGGDNLYVGSSVASAIAVTVSSMAI